LQPPLRQTATTIHSPSPFTIREAEHCPSGSLRELRCTPPTERDNEQAADGESESKLREANKGLVGTGRREYMEDDVAECLKLIAEELTSTLRIRDCSKYLYLNILNLKGRILVVQDELSVIVNLETWNSPLL